MRRRRTSPGRAVAALTVAVATAACVAVDRTDPDEAVVTMTAEPVPAPPAPAPAPDGPDPDDVGAEVVTPRPGMADVRPVPWDEAVVDGTTVTVSWWSGVEPCNVLDRVEVEETDEAVTITLFEGSDPAEPDAACIEIAQRRATSVELDEPVGQRDLVDGAD